MEAVLHHTVFSSVLLFAASCAVPVTNLSNIFAAQAFRCNQGYKIPVVNPFYRL